MIRFGPDNPKSSNSDTKLTKETEFKYEIDLYLT